MKKKLVIYHGSNCADGFGAALAAWLKFKDTADYITAQYGDSPPDAFGKDVFILDFSYKRDVLIEMAAKARSIVLIDHHKSAMNDLAGMEEHLSKIIFDMTKSGAVLSWEYFQGTAIPTLFSYIQDRDLWQWELEGSKAVSAALQIIPKVFEEWEKLLQINVLVDLKFEGDIILQYQKCQLIDMLRDKIIPMQSIAGYVVPCLNTTTLASEVGNYLAKDNPFAATYFETYDKRIYSLRSTDGGIDVSEIAKQFGGGGHKHAAGFFIDKPTVNIK
jgi:oligoribonuclease NrnB/cAMP/cGMP phosphodiesterase (DHH superfamily)